MPEFFLQTSWWIPCYGLLGALLSMPWSLGIIRRTGSRPAAYLNILMTVIALIHGAIAFQFSLHTEPQPMVLHWFHAADLDLSFAIDISPISLG
ncbi:MAG: NAD(P)H-quinone oxidoreductase subunit F, partial [Leptodesmis sp.]